MTSFALALLPLVLLVASLLARRYVGERQLARIRARLSSRARLDPPAIAAQPAATAFWGPRGGFLVACGLGGRAPPGRPDVS